MENRFISPEDIVGRLGKKATLYQIVNVDSKYESYNPLFSGNLLATL